MNTKQTILSLAALLLLTACSSDLSPEQRPSVANPDGEDLVPVEFSVSEGYNPTRAATNIVSFGSGEAVKVCVSTNGGSTYTGYDFTTAAAGQSVGLNAPATGARPYFPTGSGTTVKAYAYYPSTAGDAATFSVAGNQVDNADYKASDLMYAADRTITKGVTDGSSTLQMAHLMAQLHLNVTATGLTVNRVLVNAKRSVTFTPADGAAVVTGDASDIVAATAAGDAYVCIPVQPINTVTIKVETGAQGDAATTATFTFTSTDVFAAGNSYPISLAISAAQLGATTAITDWNGQQSVTISPSGDLNVDPIAAVTYNGSAQTPSLTVKKGSTTLSAGTDYDVEWHNNTNAGTAIVVVLGKGTTYLGSVAVAKFTINKADVTLSTAPTKKTGLTYNGSAQALVNAGSASGGTLKYKLGDGEYGNSVPTAVNANTTGYSVTYYVEGDANHNDTEETTISGITVAKKGIAAGDITLASQSLTYNGSSQTRNVSTVAGLSSEGNWSVANNSQTNAGSYELTVTMLETCQNYTGNAKASWSIARKAVTNWSISPTSLTIKDSGGSSSDKTGTITVSFGDGGTDHGAVSVSGQSTACTTSVSGATITVTGEAAGSATLSVTVAQGTNYTYSGSKNCELTVQSTGVNPLALQLGDIIYEDGTWTRNNARNTSKTAVGVVVYVAASSGAAECEAGKTCRSGSGTVVGKVLVMSLQDVSGTQAWFTANSTDHDNTLFPNCNNNTSTASNDFRGYEKTQQMATNSGECSSHTHAAATAAWNYTPSGATSSSKYLSGSTGWFLPSIGQWFKVLNAMGVSTIPSAGSWSGAGSVATTLSNYITNAGGNASTLVGGSYYWSSSEYSDPYAQLVGWYADSSHGFLWYNYRKSNAYYVRPFLAY